MNVAATLDDGLDTTGDEMIDAMKAALEAVGVTTGATVMVHGDLRQAGLTRDGAGRIALKLDPQTLFAALSDLLTPAGTVVVPSFTFSWSQGRSYDAGTSASDQGAFAEYVRCHPDARRSVNPMTSVAAVGAGAAELTGGADDYCFGSDGPYGRLHRDDALQVMIGGTWNSLNDHVQVSRGTRTRYAKFFADPQGAGADIQLCRHDVRFRCLGQNLRTSLDVVGADLGGQLKTRRVGNLDVHAVSSSALASAIAKRIAVTPYDFQEAAERTGDIDRLHALHGWLDGQGAAHFAINVNGRERWFYVLPRSLAPDNRETGAAENLIAVFHGEQTLDDDAQMLDLAATEADSALWPALQSRLRVLASCPPQADLAQAARIVLKAGALEAYK